MGRVTWRPEALRDAEDIKRFVAQSSLTYAELLVRRIFESTVRLGEFPGSGRVVPEVNNEQVREVIVGSYRVVYRVFPPAEVEVIAIIHGARLLKPQDIPR